jgi:hypothetical protein
MGGASEKLGARATLTEQAASRAYSTPHLVVLGQAYNLVQGKDVTKDFKDTHGDYYKNG